MSAYESLSWFRVGTYRRFWNFIKRKRMLHMKEQSTFFQSQSDWKRRRLSGTHLSSEESLGNLLRLEYVDRRPWLEHVTSGLGLSSRIWAWVLLLTAPVPPGWIVDISLHSSPARMHGFCSVYSLGQVMFSSPENLQLGFGELEKGLQPCFESF